MKEILVERPDLADHDVRRESLDGSPPPRLTHCPRDLRFAKERQQRLGETGGSPGGTRVPVSPSTTASGVPPTFAATTAFPAAIASRITFEKPSSCDGWTAKVEAARIPAASLRGPVRKTLPASDSLAISSLTRSIAPASLPTRTNRAAGKASTTVLAARTRSMCPL